MSNVSISQRATNSYHGTILPGGTLSSEIDLHGVTKFGLIAIDNFVSGTLAFKVSDKSDADGGIYVDLLKVDASRVTTSAVANKFAISSDVLTPLAAYRYVRLETGAAQTNGTAFKLVTKV